MKSLLEQKKLIPDENLIEIRYEDLVANPLNQVKEIYKNLNLDGFQKAKPEFIKYLDSKKDYKTNVYKIDDKIIEKIKNNWNFTLDLWDYQPPK